MVQNYVVVDQSAVSMAELANLIGITTNNAGTIVAPASFGFGNLLNQKSKLKPVEFQGPSYEDSHGRVFGKYTSLDLAQRKSVNYGHEYLSYNNPLLALRALALPRTDPKCFFRYITPYSWFRPTDFWGYNHKAGDWYQVYSKGYIGQIPKVGLNSGSLPLTFNNLDEIFSFGALQGLNMSNVNFGFLMWQGALSETNPQQMLWYQLTDLRSSTKVYLSEIQDNLVFTPTSTKAPMLTNGIWNMYPCITQNNEATAQSGTWVRMENELQGNWFMYPFCNTYQVEIVSQGQGDTEVVGNLSVEYNDKDSEWTVESGLSYTIRKLAITLVNTANTTYTVDLRAEFANKNIIRLPEGSSVNYPFTAEVTIGPGSESSPTYVDIVLKDEPKSEDDVIYLELMESGLILDVTYTITRDNTQETQNERLELNV